VRISTVSGNEEEARATLDAFAQALVGSISPVRRPVIIA